MKPLGVVIGRFQSPYLHAGHANTLSHVLGRHERVLVLIGCSPLKSTKRNPLTYEQRKCMLEAYSPRIVCLPICDCDDDSVWSDSVDNIIDADRAILYGSRDSFIPYYTGIHPTVEISSLENVDATSIRKAVPRVGDQEYLEGVVFGATNKWINAVPCVDVAILAGSNILLGRKANEVRWRFIGGFVDAGESYEDAAKREAKEETGLDVGCLAYIKSYLINDWRYRSEDQKVTTALFTAMYYGGPAIAMDDIAEVKWFNLKDDIDMIKGHEEMFIDLKGELNVT